jgi:hypothetical protein
LGLQRYRIILCNPKKISVQIVCELPVGKNKVKKQMCVSNGINFIKIMNEAIAYNSDVSWVEQ